MKNYLFLFSIFLFISIGSVAQNPNILLIIADDLGVDALNGYPVGTIKPNTPHLDSLRNSGVNFTNAWAAPVCSPTRAGILSGLYGSKNGVKSVPGNLDTSHTSLFRKLKAANPNYTVGVSGKWHITKPVNNLHPFLHGADHYMGVIEGAVSAYDNWEKTENNTTNVNTSYVTSYFTDDAIGWIKNQNNPWFMWLAHVAPHTPLHVPPAHMFSQTTTNSLFQQYLAMVESLDYEVGRLLDSLTPNEKANTTIIFIGDNGTPNNVLQDYPAMHGKASLYQGGVHVPMFVSGYGVSRIGESEEALINVIDIYATVLEITGTELPGGINNSLSFKHLLLASELPKRQYNFSELDSNLLTIKTQGFAIRNTTYKLIEYHTGQQEMFNLISDKLETDNLLLGTLTSDEENIKLELELEAEQRQNSWSCKDDIQNGDEEGIDCGGSVCNPCGSGLPGGGTQVALIELFPNPSDNSIQILSGAEKIHRIRVLNGNGKVILSYENVDAISFKLDVSGLGPNVYILNLDFPTHTISRKIVVQ